MDIPADSTCINAAHRDDEIVEAIMSLRLLGL